MKNNITEDRVSFDTAKLAKEKGFPELKYGLRYNKDGKVVDPMFSKSICSIPTQFFLAKWLWEKHKIFVSVTSTFYIDSSGKPACDGFKAFIQTLKDGKTHSSSTLEEGLCKKPEEAWEKGLFKALSLIE